MENKKDTIQEEIIVSEITEKDWKKIRNDLNFIGLMTKHAKEKRCRLIVSGGYAADGSLGQITRPHRDVDIQVYGQEDEAEQLVNQLVKEIKEGEPSLSGLGVKDKKRQDFYHSFFVEGNGLGSDVYYIQVVGNPFDNEKVVVKKDGTHTERQEFDTVQVELEGVSFETTNPTSELVDILYKREIRNDKPKPEHEQDIANLRLITDAKEVEMRFAKV